MSRIKTAYPNFVNIITPNKETPTVDLWYQRLSANGITLEQALQALDKHIDSSRFEPTIADIINNKPVLSIYDIQKQEREQEQLALKEYHENNEVVPMPDHIREKINALLQKTKVGDSE